MSGEHKSNKGGWISLLVGLPLGLFSFFIAGCIFLIPPFSLVFLFIGGGVFGQPALFLAGVPIVFAYLLWLGGQRINVFMEQGHTLLNTSRLYTMFIAQRLFASMLLLYIAGIFFFPARDLHISRLLCIGVTALLLLLLLRTAVFYTTHTVGLLIVFLTKKYQRQ